MTMIPVDWIGDKPEDAAEWERIIDDSAKAIPGQGSVRMRRVEEAWLVEAARKAGGVDFRWHVTEALSKVGKAVVGVDALQGGFPLSPEREALIRASALDTKKSAPDREALASQYDVQVVADLLAEIDRLRGKLELAGLARDLTSRAGSTLRDACDDVVPRSAGKRRRPKDA